MNRFEQELRKLFQDQYPDAVFVGRCCYIPLGEQLRAKIHFQTNGIASHYEVLRITILNRSEGTVDTTSIRLLDLLGLKTSFIRDMPKGIEPYLWEHDNHAEWYGFQPSFQDYQLMREAVNNYVAVFAEPMMHHTDRMTMRV